MQRRTTRTRRLGQVLNIARHAKAVEPQCPAVHRQRSPVGQRQAVGLTTVVDIKVPVDGEVGVDDDVIEVSVTNGRQGDSTTAHEMTVLDPCTAAIERAQTTRAEDTT